ncbi:MAG: hypothetical protein ABDH59_05635 [Fervidobacterium sp.]
MLEGKKIEVRSVKDALRYGILYLPEERKSAGLIMNFEAFKNVSILVLNRLGKLTVNTKAEIRIFEKYRRSFDIKVSEPYQITKTLSGGNQQKLVISKLVENGGRYLFLMSQLEV